MLIVPTFTFSGQDTRPAIERAYCHRMEVWLAWGRCALGIERWALGIGHGLLLTDVGMAILLLVADATGDAGRAELAREIECREIEPCTMMGNRLLASRLAAGTLWKTGGACNMGMRLGRERPE